MAGLIKLLARNVYSGPKILRFASEINHITYFKTDITKIYPLSQVVFSFPSCKPELSNHINYIKTDINKICPLSPTIFHHSFPSHKPDLTLQFRQPQPKKDVLEDKHHDSDLYPKRPINLLGGLSKSLLQYRKKDETPKKKRIPKLILLQNPLTWLMIKLDFKVLKSVWDPSFEEKDFKYGAKQAICRVTHVISEGDLNELNGLLTKAARESLLRELDRKWGKRQRSLLALTHEDIQIASPRKVYFIRIGDKKFCDVDMAFLALKWAPINSIESLLFAEIFARFHREYTPHCIPEWTIAYFKVTRFEVLRRNKK